MAVKFRESQRKVIEEYNGGLMGISAVPGSGKTFTLSHLAARLVEKVIAGGNDEQEVLIVTFSNSGVNSFKKRIADILERERKLLPYVGYRVRTLHGLAHDIVRERPALVGLADDFQIVDERIAAAILQDVVNAHLSEFSGLIDQYISSTLNEGQVKRVRGHDFPELLVQIAERFIKTAKDHQITPPELHQRLEDSDDSLE
ncbi:MAG TPA: UvrD-helicase domain-containing protein, partial [Aggregatilineales bacterium]|nr:UvrD-helicase domain-containing protein [Aggregatilineales bacterium]